MHSVKQTHDPGFMLAAAVKLPWFQIRCPSILLPSPGSRPHLCGPLCLCLWLCVSLPMCVSLSTSTLLTHMLAERGTLLPSPPACSKVEVEVGAGVWAGVSAGGYGNGTVMGIHSRHGHGHGHGYVPTHVPSEAPPHRSDPPPSIILSSHLSVAIPVQHGAVWYGTCAFPVHKSSPCIFISNRSRQHHSQPCLFSCLSVPASLFHSLLASRPPLVIVSFFFPLLFPFLFPIFLFS